MSGEPAEFPEFEIRDSGRTSYRAGGSYFVPASGHAMLVHGAAILSMFAAMAIFYVVSRGMGWLGSSPGQQESLASFQFVGIVALMVRLVLAVSLMIWTARVVRNVEALDERPPCSPAMAAVTWILPVANVYAPFTILRSLWATSDPEGRVGRYARYTGSRALVNFCWLTYLISVGGYLFGFYHGIWGHWGTGLYGDLVGYAAWLAFLMLLMMVVQQITSGQQQCYTKHVKQAAYDDENDVGDLMASEPRGEADEDFIADMLGPPNPRSDGE